MGHCVDRGGDSTADDAKQDLSSHWFLGLLWHCILAPAYLLSKCLTNGLLRTFFWHTFATIVYVFLTCQY